jgi:hypothetical protein
MSMQRTFLLCLATAGAVGCASFPPLPAPVPVNPAAPPNAASGWSITVEEFALVTEVQRYDGPPEWIGMEMAQQIANHLRRSGVQGEVAALDAPTQGQIIVRGRVTVADGGSKTARMWAPGAGGARIRVEGEVVRADGQQLGKFDRERRSARSPDSVRLVELCIDALAGDVAGMITTGTYTRN